MNNNLKSTFALSRTNSKKLIIMSLCLFCISVITMFLGLLCYNVIDYNKQLDQALYDTSGCYIQVLANGDADNYDTTLTKLVNTKSKLTTVPYESTLSVSINEGKEGTAALPILLINGNLALSTECKLIIPDSLPSATVGRIYLSATGLTAYEQEVGKRIAIGDKVNICVGMDKLAVQELEYGGISDKSNYIMADSINSDKINIELAKIECRMQYKASGSFVDMRDNYEGAYNTIVNDYGKDNVISNLIDNNSTAVETIVSVFAVLGLIAIAVIVMTIVYIYYRKSMKRDDATISTASQLNLDDSRLNVAIATQLAISTLISIILAAIIMFAFIPLITYLMNLPDTPLTGFVAKGAYPVWLPFACGGIIYLCLGLNILVTHIRNIKRSNNQINIKS